jgi:Rap1a immunity proteins
VTTADLMVACFDDEATPQRQFCLGYLLGIWDASPVGDVCARPGTAISAGMLREIFLTAVGELFPRTPAKDVPAGVAASRVMRHYFPCSER